MDRIDKFLNRRKQKTKKVVKSNNKYYEITKEDIKMVRKYKKNLCLDPSVDMYIPYNLKFSKCTENEPLDFIVKGTGVKNDEKLNKNFIRKNDYTKYIPIAKNIIQDLWSDDLSDYEQNLVLDIKDQFTGTLGDLKTTKEDLEKELRKIYLRQYLPREKKTLKISDIVKNTMVSTNLLVPNLLAKYYNTPGTLFVDKNNQMIAVCNKKRLEIYELKNFYKVYDGEMIGDIIKVEFGALINILCKTEADKTIICSLDLETKELLITSESKGVIDFSCDKYNLFITNKSIKLMETNATLSLSKIDKLTMIKTKDDLLFITTTTSLKIYDLLNKEIIADCKMFSYILDFTVCDNLIFLINNLRKVIIYDYKRNVVIHTMEQDFDVFKLAYNPVHSLLAVSTKHDIVIFYIDIPANQFSFLNKIKGGHDVIQFSTKMPWLYAKKDDRFILYT